jgi:hypothetical protein
MAGLLNILVEDFRGFSQSIHLNVYFEKSKLPFSKLLSTLFSSSYFMWRLHDICSRNNIATWPEDKSHI